MNKIIVVLLLMLCSLRPSVASSPVFVEQFMDAIVESEATQKDILLIFTAEWCKNCKIMKKDINNNIFQFHNIVISYVDIDEHRDLAKQFDVKAIPDYRIIRNTKEIKRHIGYKNFNTFLKWFNVN